MSESDVKPMVIPDRRPTMATRIIKANQQNTFCAAGLVVLCFMGLFGSAGMVVYTRPLRVTSSGALLSTANLPVSTAISVKEVHLLDLPGLSDVDLGSFKEVEYVKPTFVESLNATESLNSTTVSAAVESWTRESATRLVLQLAGETTVLLDNGGAAVLERPIGVVLFDAQGTGSVAGLMDAPEDIDVDESVAEVSALCVAQDCPLASCTGALAIQPLMVVVKHVTCVGERVWSWPQGVSLADEPDEEAEANSSSVSHSARRALQTKDQSYWDSLTCPYSSELTEYGQAWGREWYPMCKPFNVQGVYRDWHRCAQCCVRHGRSISGRWPPPCCSRLTRSILCPCLRASTRRSSSNRITISRRPSSRASRRSTGMSSIGRAYANRAFRAGKRVGRASLATRTSTRASGAPA